eukprot:TRINITY_DN94605_c0_g1_i1.p1 TRINITY_DN94605_c0_g1~~TRINITY_DN94605_c0_g1_i1.p1  ORF type:complete len:609 (+),score=90.20 TRINITY_DN94605_c0_g1_i1:79-1905(+)
MQGTCKENSAPSSPACASLQKPSLRQAGMSNIYAGKGASHVSLIRLSDRVPKSVRPEFAQHSTPRAGPGCRSNVNQVALHFQLQIRIESVEKRSVCIPQLAYIYEFANRNCYAWGAEVATMNFYDVNEWITLPATRETNTSLVEHLPGKEQLPTWFVSHWWGEPTTDFLKCVQHHSATRGLFSNSGYWVYAYASRQHGLETQIGDYDGFFSAMKSAQYSVLLVVNSSVNDRRPAVALARAWCVFECSKSLDRVAPHFDVAAVCSGGKVEMITCGFTIDEAITNKYCPGQGTATKVNREASFPMEIASVALSLNLSKVQSSVEDDSAHILNCLRAGSLHATQEDGDLEDNSLDQIQRRLRGLFSLIFWHRAVATLPSDKRARKSHLEILGDLAAAIQGDFWRRSLAMSLAGSPLHDTELVEIVWQSIPTNLQNLKLELQYTGLVNSSLEKLAASLPGTLQNLSLDISGCADINDKGINAFLLVLPTHVKELSLGLTKTQVSPGLVELSKDGLKGLTEWANANPREQSFLLSVRLQAAPSTPSSPRAAPVDLSSKHIKRRALETMLSLPESAVQQKVREQIEADLSALTEEFRQQVREQMRTSIAYASPA